MQQRLEHHQAKDVICLSVPGSTYSILQGSTQRSESEHTVPAGLLEAEAKPQNGCSPRQARPATGNAAVPQHERGFESCCHVQGCTLRVDTGHAYRTSSLSALSPFLPEMHASMISELSLWNVNVCLDPAYGPASDDVSRYF